MSEFAESYDPEAALAFPLLPSEHNRAWRYVFDWAVAGDALNCCPGDLVLEFGAGPGFASELFNRLGYRTVAFDVDPVVLGYGRRRWDTDGRLDRRRAHFVAGDGMRLPFADASFDGIVCLNALHHMPDYAATLAEMRRVLKPGTRVAFSEPGALHEQTYETKLAIERGALERSIHLDEIDRLARQVGFARVILKPYVYPYLVELAYEDFRRYRLHLSRVPFTQPHQIARFVVDHHPLFALETPGVRPLTSANARGFGALGAEIDVDPLPAEVEPADAIAVRAHLRNSGHSTWLSAAREFGGHVAFGVKFCRGDGRVIDDGACRVRLARDVAPGETVEVSARLVVPWVEPGQYRLKFDLLSEQVAWFEFFGSPVVVRPLTVRATARRPTNRLPHILRARLGVGGLPHRARAGDSLAATVTAENVGDSVWLHTPEPAGGFVRLGAKLLDGAGQLLSEGLGWTALPREVAPGERVEVRCAIDLPGDLPAGDYVLRFDLANERIAWFESYGSAVEEWRLAIEASGA